jgi:hypothetical protein
MNISDFKIVVDILGKPSYLIDYLAERQRFQKVVNIIGYELDFLGFYLQTGMNVSDLEAEKVSLALIGMSASIDRYYESRQAGVVLAKPQLRIRPYFASLVDCIEARRFPGWLGFTVDLLRSASFEEQKELDAKLAELRAKVAKNWRDPEHECCLILAPPPSRETAIVFYAFPPQLAFQRKERAKELAAKSLDFTGKDRCIVIGRNIENWEAPYTFICRLERSDL